MLSPARLLFALRLSVIFSGPVALQQSSDALPLEAAGGTQGFFALKIFPEPLVPLVADPTTDENATLLDCLAEFEKREKSDDFSGLESFLASHPTSPWRLAVATNLGLLQYRAGYYSRCLESFRAAWEEGKSATNLKPKALADRAAGEYTKMLARLGRHEDLAAFLQEVGDRKFIGSATELISAGSDGAKIMEKLPDIAYRCGPLALSRILAYENSPLWACPAIVDSKSTSSGMSLLEVAEISEKVGLHYRAAKREPGSELVMPSVIHWKAGHYAALIRKEGNRYLTQDPTFENETWHSMEALESEASGYFLVPSGNLPDGWNAVADDQAKLIYGKGYCSERAQDPAPIEPLIPTPPPPGNPGDPSCPGMAGYSFRAMLASLQLTDSPVGYRPAYGLPVYFTATYTQRDPNQPSNFNYSNLGPKWSFNWSMYLVDDPNNPATASQYFAGNYTPFSFAETSSGFHNFSPQRQTHQKLRRPVSGLPYELTNPDGSRQIYGQSDGSAASPRKVFLTQLVDPSGNTTTLHYDAQLRLTGITDALGQQTVFAYQSGADPYKITKVTDPFGRFASLEYDASGRLVKIRDVIGLESIFSYKGTEDFIESLKTPYGTTTFTTSDNGTIRRVTATDPAGDTEVLESANAVTDAIPFSEPVAPVGVTEAAQFNQYLYFRNSFHWNKKQWKEGANDYTKAHLYHWLHGENFAQMSPILESEKDPYQSRIWYAYLGQPYALAAGSQTTPIAIGRAVEGGSQITRRTYNDLGRVTSETDPLGRHTSYGYSANQVDLLTSSRTIDGTPAVLTSYTYNEKHSPLTSTDAAGHTTAYTWNTQGQVTSITNAKNEVTTYIYYTSDTSGKQRKGRLYQINGPLPGDSDIVTLDYDAVGNVAIATGSDGYYLTFVYDALDRPTRVTFPDGTYTETTFEALSPKTTRDRMGRVTTYAYNCIRQLESVTDPANRAIGYRWCKCGALSQLIDAMGRITKWRHDAAGRMTAKVYADGSEIKYAYESLSGRLSKITDEKGQVKTRTYNLDNTLVGIAYTDEEHETPDVSFTYDTDFQRIKTMLDGIGTTSYAYNPVAAGILGAGQLASVDGPLPADTLTYAYDELGRNTGYAINGVGETRTFDPLGRLLSAVNPLGTFGYTYAGATSRTDKVTYPNGMTCQYNYHPLTGHFRLKDIIHTLPGNTQLSQHSYEYNAIGNITRWTQMSPQAGLRRSWLCGYDAADQLTSVASQDPDTFAALPTGKYDYTYDLAGNRLTETIDGVIATASVNALNQLTALTTAGASLLAQQTYEWDAENRLSAINYPDGNEKTEFVYDGYSRRIGVIEKKGQDITSDLKYTWKGLKMVDERDELGLGLRKQVYTLGALYRIDNKTYDKKFYGRDHLGSVREIVSSASLLTDSYDYSPKGAVSNLLGDALSDASFAELGLHTKSEIHMGVYRAYNPASGRWLSRDPIGELGGINLYQYVSNNILMGSDPMGLYDWKRTSNAMDRAAEKALARSFGVGLGDLFNPRKTPAAIAFDFFKSGIEAGIKDAMDQHNGVELPRDPSKYPYPKEDFPLPPTEEAGPPAPNPLPEPPPGGPCLPLFNPLPPLPPDLPPPPFFWGY